MSSKQENAAGRVVVELPTLTTTANTQAVVGKRSPLSDGLDEFKGIPYGEVTKRWEHASLRTRLPVDVFDATKDGPICLQPKAARNSEYYQSYIAFPDLKQSEFDCLNLLIVRPNAAAISQAGIDPSSKLPVLIYIHGGAGTCAGSDPIYDPSRLVLRSLEIGTPIIAVNLNFRIGVFGMLGSNDILNSQGQAQTKGLNFGLNDQKVGLAWVARNITHFGGDSEQITVLGTSAGGSGLYAHVLDANASEEPPLFQKAIIQSPPLLTIHPAPLAEADGNWDRLCRHLGVELDSSSENKVEELRRVSAENMLQASLEAQVFMLPPIADGVTMTLETASFPPYQPGVQRDADREDARGRQPIEVLFGTAEVESAGHAQGGIDLAKIRQAFTASYPTASAANEVLEAYGLVESSEQRALQQGLERFHSDAVFDFGTYRARNRFVAERRSKYGDATSIQSYHVEFGNPFPGPRQGCAHHCVEGIYMFNPFYDALADASKGIFRTYAESREVSEHPRKPDTEIATPKTTAVTDNIVSNHLKLAEDFQDYIIGFMVGSANQRVVEGEVLVWDKTGSSRVERLVESSKWAEKIGRLKLLEEDPASMFKTFPSI